MSSDAQLALDLIEVYRKHYPPQRYLLRPLLVEMEERFISEALHQDGYERFNAVERPSKHIFRTKIWVATGKDLDRDAYCQGETKEGRSCGLRPQLGITRCHHHASRSEMDEAEDKKARWAATLEIACDNFIYGPVIDKLREALTLDF